ncbi:Na/Pi cotransporter family protein [Chitinivibrio alkaliphilus]|uniref:Na+/Pi-cotransporter n=1 Tax=Chitinivibrio alkaliphilus ACht1 TaxID=1313304 RepID=U7D8G8_9BACT|nr:Na/Pi cotransporter family protein [Chitinivibrio alkaliphilus]ERP31372.1 Na+/Pi-cotransporter [Chitinivibrio alkaliphilus ACht1]
MIRHMILLFSLLSLLSTVSVFAGDGENLSSETAMETLPEAAAEHDFMNELEGITPFTEAILALPMVFFIVGGLAIFLLGMNYMSSGLQTIAGSRLRSIIATLTNNRFSAVLVGFVVTVIVQSSSITTVMTVGFVNSGLMVLRQALGIIFGSNIGTTLTGWIIALNVGRFGLPILGIATFFYLFSKRDSIKYTALAFLGIGMVFFGLQLMTHGFRPFANSREFEALFLIFNTDTYLSMLMCVLLGAFLTVSVQSSSATMGITIALSVTGAIPFETAAALVLGENIGTTITAFLASLTTGANAKRAAYGHIIFNVVGVLWITSIFPFYISFIESLFERFSDTLQLVYGNGDTGGAIAVKIAMVHTVFNTVNTLVFIPLLGPLERLLFKLVPQDEEQGFHITELQTLKMHESPTLALAETSMEIRGVAEQVSRAGAALETYLTERDSAREKAKNTVFEIEEKVDLYQKELSDFLVEQLSTKELSHDVVQAIQNQFRVIDDYESISDYYVTALKRLIKIEKKKLFLDEDEREEILRLHRRVGSVLDSLRTYSCHEGCEKKGELLAELENIRYMIKDIRKNNLNALKNRNRDENVFISLTFADILTAYKKINNHFLSILELAE